MNLLSACNDCKFKFDFFGNIFNFFGGDFNLMANTMEYTICCNKSFLAKHFHHSFHITNFHFHVYSTSFSPISREIFEFKEDQKQFSFKTRALEK